MTSVPDSVDIAGLLFISHLTHVRQYAQLCLPWLLVSVHTQTWVLGIFWHRYCTASGLLDYILLLIFFVMSLVRDHRLRKSNGEQRFPLAFTDCILCLPDDEWQTQHSCQIISFFKKKKKTCFPLLWLVWQCLPFLICWPEDPLVLIHMALGS